MESIDTSSHYSESAFWNKLQDNSKSIGCTLIEKVLTLFYLIQDDSVSAVSKGLIIGALGYFILPLDVIPDVIPVIGYSDDLVVISAVLIQLESRITPAILKQVQKAMPNFCR